MRKDVLLSAVIAALFALITSSANAMPAAPALAGISKDDQMVVKVRGGCGRGYHRGPRGGCRRNR
jgi:hypothetical protein